jgi:hypothetical protein
MPKGSQHLDSIPFFEFATRKKQQNNSEKTARYQRTKQRDNSGGTAGISGACPIAGACMGADPLSGSARNIITIINLSRTKSEYSIANARQGPAMRLGRALGLSPDSQRVNR